MAIWREDDPPFNIGTPRESHLWRRVHRLRMLEKRKPGRFSIDLAIAERHLELERTLNEKTMLLG